MARLHNIVRHSFACGVGATLILLVLAAAEDRVARAHDAAVPTPAPAKTEGAASKASSIKGNVKKLGQEITDPGTPARIKAHEQELEKKVERTRDRQRKDHGTAKPHDAVDLAKGLDAPEAGDGKAKGAEKPKVDGKAKVEDKTKPKVEEKKPQ